MRASRRIRSHVGFFFLAAAFCVSSVGLSDRTASGLGRYQSFVVSDSPVLSNLAAPVSSAVRVTYLGTNGYLLQTSDSTILIDPYFSRIALMPVASNSAIRPDISRINSGMDRLPKRIDAILVTHGHFDHLLDVPEIARRTGASVIASPTSCYLSQAFGLPATKTLPVQAGDSLQFGATRVHVFPATHDRIFGVMPFPGVRTAVPLSPPRRPSDWVCGEPLAFLIELEAKRIYVDAGGTVAALPPMTVGPVDLAILGAYLPESRRRFLPALYRLRPRYILPSHQDDFFRPLSDGFQFGPMTKFTEVLLAVKKYEADSHPTARLILLDYFAPWTLR
jgi:L-ascorbate metabolism protein UlaG (beta-lactamase superfamily)